MRSHSLTLTLVAAMIGAAVAACGDSTPTPQTPPPPTPSAATGKPDVAPPATTAAVTPRPTDTGKAPEPPRPAGDPNLMRPVTASTMADDLKEAGFDINKLPPMSKMSGAQKAKVMKAISKATGMSCKKCHVDGDFKKDTPNRIIARHMWDEYTVALKLSDSSPLFCDSCHHNHDDILTRGPDHRSEVSAYMDANYVQKFAPREGGGAVACSTCHGASMEYDIFNNTWKAGKQRHASAQPAAHGDSPALAGR